MLNIKPDDTLAKTKGTIQASVEIEIKTDIKVEGFFDPYKRSVISKEKRRKSKSKRLRNHLSLPLLTHLKYSFPHPS